MDNVVDISVYAPANSGACSKENKDFWTMSAKEFEKFIDECQKALKDDKIIND